MPKRATYKRSPEQELAWRHNSLVGCCWMARSNAECIVNARSATPEARAIAQLILELTHQLATALKERNDGL